MSSFFLLPDQKFNFDRDFLDEKLKKHYTGIDVSYINDDSRQYELSWCYTACKRYLDGMLSKDETSVAFEVSDLEF